MNTDCQHPKVLAIIEGRYDANWEECTAGCACVKCPDCGDHISRQEQDERWGKHLADDAWKRVPPADDPLADAIDFDGCPVCNKVMGWFPCNRCGDEGHVEYIDTPEAWGEDCPSEENHFVTCPVCRGDGGVWWCPNCGEEVVPVDNEEDAWWVGTF